MSGAVAFALASALHAGFQLTVTAVVYPALGARPARDWSAAHSRHSRTIAPVVAIVYGCLVATAVMLIAAGPDVAGWLSLVGAAAAVAVTACLAAPLHGRLTVRDEVLLARLLVIDKWRCLFAVAGAAAAVLAALEGG